jgi:two-component system nitrogen regulation response regulator GlnG
LEDPAKDSSTTPADSPKSHLYKLVICRIEKPLIESILKKTAGNKIKAARILGINRNTLHSKVVKFGINVEKFKKI